MARVESAEEAGANFSDLISSVHATKEEVIVEREGQPYAVVITPEQYSAMRSERAWATVDRVRERNADKDPNAVLADVTAEVEAARRDREWAG